MTTNRETMRNELKELNAKYSSKISEAIGTIEAYTDDIKDIMSRQADKEKEFIHNYSDELLYCNVLLASLAEATFIMRNGIKSQMNVSVDDVAQAVESSTISGSVEPNTKMNKEKACDEYMHKIVEFTLKTLPQGDAELLVALAHLKALLDREI